jgi:hypothetical protein
MEGPGHSMDALISRDSNLLFAYSLFYLALNLWVAAKFNLQNRLFNK